MAKCGFAVQRLLPESSTQPRITPRVAIMHSAAGRGSLYNFFLKGSNLESHFWVSETGVIEQYVDTNVRADANNKANGFAISIETESSPGATEEWNPVQFAAIVKLLKWICAVHGIPPVKCVTWNGRGIGYHIQFGAPGAWTPVSKSCPGPARVKQMPKLILLVAGQGDPNKGRPLLVTGADFKFSKGATDEALYAKGYRNDMIKEAQMLLDIEGYYGGAIDGIWDSEPIAAWVKFLQDQKKLNPKAPAFKNPSSLVTGERMDSLRAWASL